MNDIKSVQAPQGIDVSLTRRANDGSINVDVGYFIPNTDPADTQFI